MPKTLTKKVPAAALKIGLEAVTFAAGDPIEGSDPNKIPLKMRARGGQPLYHWYWGAVVHDMAGFKADQAVIPVDWCHTDDLMGALDKFTPSDGGLDVEGFLAKVRDDDRVSEVKAKSDLGIPYQASIFFDPKSIEEVPAGSSTEVNGYTLAGPATIIRQWSLRGVAICPYGYDNQTNSKFSAGDAGEIEVPLTLTAMTKITTKPADGAPANTELTTEPNDKPLDVAQFTKQAQDLLKDFVTRFGAENGSKWFGEGKPLSESLELHATDLQTKLAAKETEITELKTRLAAAKTGEASPVSLTDTEKDPPSPATPAGKFAHLGEGAAKFAAGIKLPGKTK
jgi:hypothetical protein